jgi:hypothetical protein
LFLNPIVGHPGAIRYTEHDRASNGFVVFLSARRERPARRAWRAAKERQNVRIFNDYFA